MFGTKEEKVRIREMFFFLFYFNAIVDKESIKKNSEISIRII